MGWFLRPSPVPVLPLSTGRAKHVARFELFTELEGVRLSASSARRFTTVTRVVVVDTKPEAQHLPMTVDDREAVAQVLFCTPWLKPDEAIEKFVVAERVVERMNQMNLALRANTPKEVFNYLWEQDTGEKCSYSY